MKFAVNGQRVDALPGGGEITPRGDRLFVRTPEGTFSAVAVRRGDTTYVSFRGQVYEIQRASASPRGSASGNNGTLVAPMPGLVIDVLVREGEAVQKGQRVLILEAMKTQQPMVAPFAGVARKIAVKAGQQVKEREILAEIAEDSA